MWLALEGQRLTAGSDTATVEELSDSAVTVLHCGLWLDAPYHPHNLIFPTKRHPALLLAAQLSRFPQGRFRLSWLELSSQVLLLAVRLPRG